MNSTWTDRELKAIAAIVLRDSLSLNEAEAKFIRWGGLRKPRRGRGKASKNLKLIEAAIRIFAEIAPATIRACCYRLFNEGFIPDMSAKSTQRVSEQLTYARNEGLLPWDHVVDETRRPETVSTWSNPEECFGWDANQYRLDYWNNQPGSRIEVWSEKGTVRGTLAPVLNKYAVTFRVFHGFISTTLAHDLGEMTKGVDIPLVALYVGDMDPSGMWMSERDLPERIKLYEGKVEMTRIAMTKRDATDENFPFPAKKADARHDWYVKTYGSKAWELDALNPNILRDRVEAEILKRIDRRAWERSAAAEKLQQAAMRGFLETYPSKSELGWNSSDDWMEYFRTSAEIVESGASEGGE